LVVSGGRIYGSADEGLYRLVPAPTPGEAATWETLPTNDRTVRDMADVGGQLLMARNDRIDALDGDTFVPLLTLQGMSIAVAGLPDVSIRSWRRNIPTGATNSAPGATPRCSSTRPITWTR
jgi:hypothetical protein